MIQPSTEHYGPWAPGPVLVYFLMAQGPLAFPISLRPAVAPDHDQATFPDSSHTATWHSLLPEGKVYSRSYQSEVRQRMHAS